MLIPSSALLSACHPVTPSPHLPPLPHPFVCFPELGVSHGLSPSLIFPHSVLLFSLIIPFTISYIPRMSDMSETIWWLSISDWLTSLSNNTLQFHPCQSKWWVFVISNGWVIFHCIHRPHLCFTDVVYRVDGFTYMLPSMHPQNPSHWIMVVIF